MTIQFLRSWNGFEFHQTANLAPAEESRLIAVGIAQDFSPAASPRAALVPWRGDLEPKVPYALAQSGVPVILPSSGSSNATGQITFNTALPYSLFAGQACAVYLPASVTGTAGVFAATGTGSASIVQLVGSPTTANAAFTQDTGTALLLASVPIPGGSLGSNGAVRIQTVWSYPNNANTKTITERFGGSTLSATGATTTSTARRSLFIRNRGAADRQLLLPATLATQEGTTTTTASQLTVDTAAAQAVDLRAQLAVAADYIILEAYTVEILPSGA